jgi:hypothetical protein
MKSESNENVDGLLSRILPNLIDPYSTKDFYFSDSDSEYSKLLLQFAEIANEPKSADSYAPILKKIASGLQKLVGGQIPSNEERVYLDITKNQSLQDAIRVIFACSYDEMYYVGSSQKLKEAKRVLSRFQRRVQTLLKKLDKNHAEEVRHFLQEYVKP